MRWRSGYVREYPPSVLDHIFWGIGKYIWILFILSPYLFIPYIFFRWVDKAPDPALYILLFVIPGAFAAYYGIKYCLTRLQSCKMEGGGFRAQVAFFLASIAILFLRVWSVKAGFYLLLRPNPLAHGLSIACAVLYCFLLLNGYVNRRFVYGKG